MSGYSFTLSLKQTFPFSSTVFRKCTSENASASPNVRRFVMSQSVPMQLPGQRVAIFLCPLQSFNESKLFAREIEEEKKASGKDQSHHQEVTCVHVLDRAGSFLQAKRGGDEKGE